MQNYFDNAYIIFIHLNTNFRRLAEFRLQSFDYV